MKLGAIAVPLFTLFGPDGVRSRVDDCSPRLLLTTPDKAQSLGTLSPRRDCAGRRVCRVGVAISHQLCAGDARRRSGDLPVHVWHNARTARRDPSHPSRHRRGHDRGAVWHRHPPGRPVLLSVIAGLGSWTVARDAGTAGAWRGDRRLCRPLRRGTAAARIAGFRHHQSVGGGDALPHDAHVGRGSRYRYALRKLSFTGEPIDGDSLDVRRTHLRHPPVQHVRHDRGRRDPRQLSRRRGFHRQSRVRLACRCPASRSEVQRPDGSACAAGEIGEIKVWRHGTWFPTKDRGWIDADGFFFHAGRADDVIISAGWTMSATEIEDVLLRHPAVREAAAIGVPDTAARPGGEGVRRDRSTAR